MKRFTSFRLFAFALTLAAGYVTLAAQNPYINLRCAEPIPVPSLDWDVTPEPAPAPVCEMEAVADTLEYKMPQDMPEPVLMAAEVMPEFPGGVKALQDFIAKHLNYPVFEAENGIEGKVVVQFVVEKDGSIGDVRIVRGMTKGLDMEAIRVCMKLPNFKPALQRGKPCRVWFTLPVSFVLD